MAVAVTSCNKSPEEKAQALIEDAVKKTLYVPESYDPVETKIDSAFAPQATQEYIECTMDMCKAYNEIAKYDEKAKDAKSSMSIFSDGYSEFGRNEYLEHKAEYEKALKKKNAAEKRMNDNLAKLRKMEEQKPTFIGYSVIHRYRAETNGGQTAFGTLQFFLDKDMENIIATFDLDDEETQDMENTLEEMEKEGIFE